MTDINAKFNNAICDVVTETQGKNWPRVIEATLEIASMVKSSGIGEGGYQAIMENLHIGIREHLGQAALDEFAHVIQHRAHYLNNPLIVLPH